MWHRVVVDSTGSQLGWGSARDRPKLRAAFTVPHMVPPVRITVRSLPLTRSVSYWQPLDLLNVARYAIKCAAFTLYSILRSVDFL